MPKDNREYNPGKKRCDYCEYELWYYSSDRNEELERMGFKKIVKVKCPNCSKENEWL